MILTYSRRWTAQKSIGSPRQCQGCHTLLLPSIPGASHLRRFFFKGTVFLKRKNQFLKGRTIISYRFSLLSKLLAAASLAITSMLESLWPNAPGLQSMPKLWGLLHQFLREAPVELELCEWNDDLIGFFNNVPRHQIIDALRSVVQQFFNSFNQVFIPVDIVKKQAQTRVACKGQLFTVCG